MPEDWYEKLFSPDLDDWEDAIVVLSPVTVQALERQLNDVTPWHVRVTVESRRLGTGVICKSRFWGAAGQGAGGDSELSVHLLTSCCACRTSSSSDAWSCGRAANA